jgi:hypothetical protein
MTGAGGPQHAVDPRITFEPVPTTAIVLAGVAAGRLAPDDFYFS